MRKITRQEVLAAIWASRSAQFQDFILAKNWTSCPYNFENFTRDMLRGDTISDKRTLRTKWDMLECGGVVRSNGRGLTEIAFDAFSDLMPATTRIQLHDIMRSEERHEKTSFTTPGKVTI